MPLPGGLNLDPSILPAFDVGPSDDRPKPGPLKAGLVAGIHELASLGGSAVQGIGKLEGFSNPVGGQFAADQNAIAARQRPDLDVAPWQQGGASVAPWLEYQAAKLVPTLAGYGLATAAVPEAAVPAGAARVLGALPEFLGGAGAAAAPEAIAAAGRGLGRFILGGGTFGAATGFGQAIQSADQKPGGVTTSDVGKALAEAPLYGAAGLLEPGLFKGLFGAEGGNLLTKVATRALSGPAVGAVQSGMMTALDQSFRPDLTGQQKMDNISDAALSGAAIGGLLGGAAGLKEHFFPHNPVATPEDGMHALKRVDPSQIDTGSIDKAVDQALAPPAPPAAPEPSTDLAEIPTEHLQAAAAHPDVTPEVSDRIQQELAARNAPLTTSALNPTSVEAVELKGANQRGTGEQPDSAPVSTTSPDVDTYRAQLTDGLKLPKTLADKIDNAGSLDDIQNIVHDETIVDAKGGKGRIELAKRAGLLDDEGKPTPLADAVAARKAGSASEAPVDEAFQDKWQQETKGVDDPAVKDLHPKNEPDAQLQIYRALGDDKIKSDSDSLENLAVKYGVLDKDSRTLTPLGVELAKRDPIPLDTAVKAADAQGFKGADASVFDRGVQDYVKGADKPVSFDTPDAQKAYEAGQQFAEETNSVPKGALKKYDPKAQLVPDVTQTQAAQISGDIPPPEPRTVPPEVRQLQQVNEAIDNAGLTPAKDESDIAALKTMVRNGDIEGAMMGLQKVQRGESLFEQPGRQPAQPFKGEKATPGAPRQKPIAELVPTRGASRAEADVAIRKYELSQAIQAAHDAGAIGGADRLRLVNQLRQGRLADVRAAIPDEFMKAELQRKAALPIDRAARRAAYRDQLEEAAQRGQEETPELQPDQNGILRYRQGQGETHGTPADDIRDAVHQATRDWKGDVPVNIVDHVGELPENLQRAIHKDGAEDAHGFVHDGQVYLIGENIRDKEHALATVYHEALGHLGLDSLFRKQLDAKLLEMYRGNELLRREVDTWRKANPSAYKGNLARAVEEVFAEKSERGIADASLTSKIGAIIKNFGRRLGMKLDYSDKEIGAILSMAHDQIINGKQESGAQKGMRYMMSLWHGSPHDFDHFLTDHIGTGEGHQAYGWGLYFAGDKAVAQHYRTALAGRPQYSTKDIAEYFTPGRVLKGSGYAGGDKVLKFHPGPESNPHNWSVDVQSVKHDGTPVFGIFGRVRNHATRPDDAKLREVLGREPTEHPGKLYNALVKQTHDRFLDLDKPLSEQSQHVKDALAKLGFEEPKGDDLERLKAVSAEVTRLGQERDALGKEYSQATARERSGKMTRDQFESVRSRWISAVDAFDQALDAREELNTGALTGKEMYAQLEIRNMMRNGLDRREAARAASMTLKEAGIAGNTYADGFSRGKDSGSNNYVVFNHDDVDIAAKYSRPAEVNQGAKDVIGKLSDVAERFVRTDTLKGKARDFQLYIADRHHIVEQFAKWFTRPDNKPGPLRDHELAERQRDAIKAKMTQGVNDSLDRYNKLRHADKKSGQNIPRVMTGTEFPFDTTRPWKDQPEVAKAAPHLEPLHDKYFNKWRSLSPEAKQVFADFRAQNDAKWLADHALVLHATLVADTRAAQELGATIHNTPGDKFMSEQRSLSPAEERAWWYSDVNDRTTAITNYVNQQLHGLSGKELTEQKKLYKPLTDAVSAAANAIGRMEAKPYFHLGRFGDFAVDWKVTDQAALGKLADLLESKGFKGIISKDSDKNHVFMRLDNETQQNELAQILSDLSKGNTPLVKELDVGRLSKESYGSKLMSQSMQRLIGSIQDNPHFDEDAKKTMTAGLRKTILDLMPENAIDRINTHRNNIPGYSGDMIRSYADRLKIGVDSFANMVVGPKVAQAFTDMRGMIREARTNPDFQKVPTEQRNGMQQVYDELSRRQRERAEWGHNKILDQLARMTSVHYLGLSPAFGFVQMSQLGVATLPELGARYGYLKSSAEMARATGFAFKIMGSIFAEGKKVSLTRAMDAVVTRNALLKTSGMTPRMADFLMSIANSGHLDLGGQIRELVRAADGQENATIGKAMRYATAIGYYSETMSRLIAAIATHNLEGRDQPVSEVADKARHVLDETLFNFSSENLGRVFSKKGFLGVATPLAAKFMSYQAQLTGKLYREVYKAIRSDDPVERAQAQRFLAGHLASMTILAGTLGLPLVTAAAAAYDNLKDAFSDDGAAPSDIRSDFREYMSSVFGNDIEPIIDRGASRAVGVDVSERLGEQNLLPFSKFLADKRRMKDSITDLQSRSWGAPSAMISSYMEGIARISQGDVLGGMTAALPQGLANPLKAYRMANGEFVDASGKPLPMTPSTRDVIVQALGFTPAQRADYTERSTAQKNSDLTLSQQATVLRNRMVDAMASRDQGAIQDLAPRIAEFDRNNPTRGSVMKSIEAAYVNRIKSGTTAAMTQQPVGVKPGSARYHYGDIQFAPQAQ